MKNKKIGWYKIGLSVLLGVLLLVGVSYAWFTLTIRGANTNVLKAGDLSLILDENGNISLGVTQSYTLKL